MKIDPKKDYLYKDNKYINNDVDVVLSQSFIFKRKLARILTWVVGLLAFSIVLFLGYKIMNPSVMVSGQFYNLNKDISNLAIDDKVAYETNLEYTDQILLMTGFYPVTKYSVVTLPSGISSKTGKQLGKNQYVLRCEVKACNGNLIEVEQEGILGRLEK